MDNEKATRDVDSAPSMTRPKAEAEAGARLSIGALSRATGVPVETLRTWEARYGFPVPERRPSGHRVYPVGSVPRLRRIAEALARGHRAGDVVSASDRDLSALLDATGGPGGEQRGPLPASPLGIEELVDLVAAFDADRLTRILLGDWARMGPLEFLEGRVAPLIRAVGDAWEAGRLEIRHEHFLSERVGDVLRSLRLPFEERAAGPLVAVATLPGEAHGLGLQMAALTLATSGWRILFLGTEVPPPQIAALARDLSARAVAVSVSIASRGKATNAHLRRLRGLLPRRVALLVGGEGAPRARAGLEVFSDLRGLDAWGRRAAGPSRGA
jgi:methanogenic corrinoid protein MtbC1